MSRFRLLPTAAQEARLLEHCAHARFIWNPAVTARGGGASARPANRELQLATSAIRQKS
ncbi:helix-turn-helix domain-containing protein [Amycolatopsis sp. cmx-11-12]|uniref:helix-turn-helix domain-containing protein n=1 Tax=Amycolatopsis sp. cmx-11-12 TaxID=2785795 RepID=UPI0039171EAB